MFIPPWIAEPYFSRIYLDIKSGSWWKCLTIVPNSRKVLKIKGGKKSALMFSHGLKFPNTFLWVIIWEKRECWSYAWSEWSSPSYTHTHTQTLTKALQNLQEEISKAERTLLRIGWRLAFPCKPWRRSNKIELTFEVPPLHCRLKQADYFESDYCTCVKSCCLIKAAIQARLPQDKWRSVLL